MELVVVMLILAAIAGVLLPLLPNMITRAHTSTSATNLGEIAKAIQTHQAAYNAYPSKLDSLLTGSNTLAPYLPAVASGELTTLTLDDDSYDALEHSGILQMANLLPTTSGDWSPTFFPYGTNANLDATYTTLTSGINVATITGTAAVREFSAPFNASYVVFGLGSRSTMQNKTLMESPVHYSEHANEAPSIAYARYGIVFQLTGGTTGTEPLDKARLVGICAFHKDGIEGLNKHLAEYWNANKQ
jgi:type II secretory pathway pseudopilin PulG